MICAMVSNELETRSVSASRSTDGALVSVPSISGDSDTVALESEIGVFCTSLREKWNYKLQFEAYFKKKTVLHLNCYRVYNIRKNILKNNILNNIKKLLSN